ncbi:MAG: ABC transporter permease [Deltaproteobacteria bacterium]|nr:MAG: ABC transporter permease [Deltaproteobacteria bacterium]
MRVLAPAAVALAALLLWAALASVTSPVLLPAPLDVARALVEGRASLAEATLHTALASLGGLGIATLLGLCGAVLFHLSRTLELALYPYALVIQTLPVIAVAPLLVVWLDYGTPVAVASAAIVSFFVVLTSAHRGLSAADRGQVELLRLYGASRWQELRLLRLPASLPHVLAGLRSAGGLAVIGAVVGEFVGSNGVPRSLGYEVLYAIRTSSTDHSFAAIVCASALSSGYFLVVRLAERLVVGRWSEEDS